MSRKQLLTLVALLSVCTIFSGCKKEPTQEEVEGSKYYSGLLKQYDKLKQKNDKLKEQLAATKEKTPKETEIDTLLDKIGRDSLIKMEIDYADGGGSIFTDNKGVLSLANDLAMTADPVTRYSVDDIKLNYDATYKYVLYDEDNSVFGISVFEGDYIIFDDIPDQVFYAYSANKFGKAYLQRKRYYPDIKFMTMMIESPIVVRGNKAYDNTTVYKAVSCLATIDKTKIKKDKVDEDVKTEYLFLNHATVLTVSIGKHTIHMEGNGVDQWYKVSEASITDFKSKFQK